MAAGAVLANDNLRRQRHARRHWYVDETYAAVQGQWAYLYRALDGEGQWVDVRLSEYRDLDAARAFFESARGGVGQRPKQVSTDGHTPYPRAIEETLGKRVEHRSICGLGNPIEQDHRGIQPRYYPTLGFTVFKTAAVSAACMTKCGIIFDPGRRWGTRSPWEETAAVHWTVPEWQDQLLGRINC
jgi:transposase-like protein